MLVYRLLGILCLSVLFSHHAYPQIKADDIIEAAMLGKVKQVSAFLAAGADINQQDEDGANALTTAINFKREKMVEMLLSKGAEWPANIGDGEVFYESLWSITKPINRPILEILLTHGYDINQKTKNGESILHVALATLEYSHPKTIKDVEYLIEKGADVNSKDESGASVIWTVCQYDGEKDAFIAVIDLLLDKGADINAKDHEKDNLLAMTGCQQPTIKEYLISKGAIDFYQ